VRQRVLHRLEALSHRLTKAGQHAEAVEAALAAVSVEPLRESGQHALIQARLAEDNWVEARCHYELYRQLARRQVVRSGVPRAALPGAHDLVAQRAALLAQS
jgi:hypothetical protein